MRSAYAVAAALVLSASGCSLIGGGDESADAKSVVLVTHESFVMSDALKQQFEEESGYDLTVRASGDAGALTNKLVLTKDDPTGDVVFGIDNTFGSRALDEGVLQPYDAELARGEEQYRLAGDDEHALTPVDRSSVCVNVDTTWFAAHQLQPPSSLEDLTDPAYKDLFVTPGATTSSPGLAFLLSTVAAYGDDWQDYWTRLMANGAQLTSGWSDAYEVDFTQGGGSGDRPIVLSYDTSPAFTVADGATTTAVVPETCFRQVEYAGVLAGAANPEGAEALVDFMLGTEFQEALPEAMYVYPVDPGAALPADWEQFAKPQDRFYDLDPAEVAANRDTWLREWSDVTSG
jgi:thiamine transport system substrate-binding protein